MKKFTGVAVVVLILAAGVFAYAHGPGSWGGGIMQGKGYGQHMQGMGPGNHMMGPMQGWAGMGYGPDKDFLDETADVRKELHDKKFEYFEAVREKETPPETIAQLEKEIGKLQEKIAEKASGRPGGRFGGFGCW